MYQIFDVEDGEVLTEIEQFDDVVAWLETRNIFMKRHNKKEKAGIQKLDHDQVLLHEKIVQLPFSELPEQHLLEFYELEEKDNKFLGLFKNKKKKKINKTIPTSQELENDSDDELDPELLEENEESFDDWNEEEENNEVSPKRRAEDWESLGLIKPSEMMSQADNEEGFDDMEEEDDMEFEEKYEEESEIEKQEILEVVDYDISSPSSNKSFLEQKILEYDEVEKLRLKMLDKINRKKSAIANLAIKQIRKELDQKCHTFEMILDNAKSLKDVNSAELVAVEILQLQLELERILGELV